MVAMFLPIVVLSLDIKQSRYQTGYQAGFFLLNGADHNLEENRTWQREQGAQKPYEERAIFKVSSVLGTSDA